MLIMLLFSWQTFADADFYTFVDIVAEQARVPRDVQAGGVFQNDSRRSLKGHSEQEALLSNLQLTSLCEVGRGFPIISAIWLKLPK